MLFRSTRTTIVLSTPYENRPPDLEHAGEFSTGPDGGDPEGPIPDGADLHAPDRPAADGPGLHQAGPEAAEPGRAG